MIKKYFSKIIPLLFILFIIVPIRAESDYWKSQKYADLITELKKIGFSGEKIDAIFSDPRVSLYPNIMKKFEDTTVSELTGPDSKLLSEKSVNDGKKFMRKNRELLERVERKYGVENDGMKETIAAILRIESYFGLGDLGSFQVFGVLSSIILYSEPDSGRSEWAKKHLIAFFIAYRKFKIKLYEIEGSWAGAFGIPQFLLVSYLNFAIDGNKDGKIDLFNLEDAVYSVANYLIKHGWKNNKSKTIFLYNRDLNFVAGVEAYAKKLKEK